MKWTEVVMIMFSCVAANHLGLIAAIENVLHRRLPIINCPKCFTFWSVSLYGIWSEGNAITILATSFLFAYLSTWLQLLMAIIDNQYNTIYDTLLSTNDTAADGTELS